MAKYRRTCLVLDIDETLVHSSEDRALYNGFVKKYANDFETLSRIRSLEVRIPSREGRIQTYLMWTLLRPGWDRLLSEARKTFTYVGIYSAGTREYVEACVEIFSKVIDIDFVLSKDDMLHETKPLKVVLSILPEEVAFEDIVLIDDIRANFHANPKNGHEIAPYSPETPCSSDNCLYQIITRFPSLSFESASKVLYNELS